MIALLQLLLAHFIGDFMLQPYTWVKEKEARKALSPKLYAHVLLHGILVLLVTWNLANWPLALLLMLIHGSIDLLKLYANKEHTRTRWFLIDQLLHLISIVVLWMLFFEPQIEMDALIPSETTYIMATALLFITSVSGIVIQVLMSGWSNALKDGQEGSLMNAGKYIGILERLFVFTFVLTGHWEGIGFLLAAKSVFRFGDLNESKDRKLTEYILIGTLLSFGMAMACAMTVTWLMEHQ